MTYYVYVDRSGQYRWQLQAANNRIIADSGESYRNRDDCIAGIRLVQNSSTATIVNR